MAVGVVRFVGEPIVVHYFSTHKRFERERGKHVEAEEEARNVDHEVVIWEVVKHVAQRLVAKGQVARESHDETCDQGDAGAIVCYAREAVDGGFAQGAVDEQAIVMADESEGYDANGFEYTRVDNKRAAELAFGFGRYTECLCRDGYDDDNHADQCQTAGLGELLGVSLCSAKVLVGYYFGYVPVERQGK